MEIVVTDRGSVNSMLMGLEIAAALAKMYPQNFDVTKMITLVGNANTISRLETATRPRRLFRLERGPRKLRKIRAKYLIY